MKDRIEAVRDLLKRTDTDAALLTSGENIRYFTGFTSTDGVVLVSDHDAALFTDFRYIYQAKEQIPDMVRLVETGRGSFNDALKEYIRKNDVRTIGFEENAVTVGRFDAMSDLSAEWKRMGKEISSIRLQKSDTERENLQSAQNIADIAYSELLNRVRPGMTEKEVAAELDYLGAMHGSEGPSFETIVGSGPNGAMCHAVPGDRKLQQGDLVVVDFGCIKNGYHSDTTRTFAIGPIDPELERIYSITLEAQLLVLENLKPGMKGRDLDRIARDHISKHGYGKCFGHSLGHGVGLLIHESPYASATSEDILLPGTTITVEPGIYLEGKGGVRIEDCCMLTENGFLDFTKLPKELIRL